MVSSSSKMLNWLPAAPGGSSSETHAQGAAGLGGQVRDFIECIKTRRPAVSQPELVHRAHTVAHCANICPRLGRKPRWDPEAERFAGDQHANRLLRWAMRASWQI